MHARLRSVYVRLLDHPRHEKYSHAKFRIFIIWHSLGLTIHGYISVQFNQNVSQRVNFVRDKGHLSAKMGVKVARILHIFFNFYYHWELKNETVILYHQTLLEIQSQMICHYQVSWVKYDIQDGRHRYIFSDLSIILSRAREGN